MENGPSLITQAHWSPPQASQFIVDVDGAVFMHQKSAGIGVVVKDSTGRIIEAFSKKIKAPLGAVEVEARLLNSVCTLRRT